MKDDLISRQAAIDAITQYLGRIKRDFNQWEGTARIILDHVPSAQPGCEAWHKTIDEGFPSEGEQVLVTDGKYFWLDESVANDVGLQWESGQSLWERTEWAYFKDLYKKGKSK